MALTKVTYSMIEGAPVNVKDFGAKGDGVTDDTAAIQAAINYCTNLANRKQTLYFPAMKAATAYKITAPLVITSRLNIVGDGQFSTAIHAYGMSQGQYIIDYNCAALDVVYYSGISNITILSDNGAPTGVRLNNISYMLMKQVQLANLYKGIYITGTNTFSNFFEQVTAYNIGYTSVQWENFTGGGQYMFSGCTFTGNFGVLLSNTAATDALGFYDCNWEQCVEIDLYVTGSVRGLTINGCRSEGLNGPQSFRIEPAAGKFVSGLNITGCFWQSDFGAGDPVYISGNVQGFNITGNTAEWIGLNQFVNLNGAGQAGVISGNYCANSPNVVSANRAGVYTFANRNGSGDLPDYFGVNSSYTATATGMTTSPTGAVLYSIVGNMVTLDIPAISGTSNAITFTLAGMPTILRPESDKNVFVVVVNNGTTTAGLATIKTTGVIELSNSLDTGTAFTNSGTKGINAISVSYTLA